MGRVNEMAHNDHLKALERLRMLDEANDRIDRLEAENKRLRGALNYARDRIEVMGDWSDFEVLTDLRMIDEALQGGE